MAAAYERRFSEPQSYHHFMYRQRLESATRRFRLSGKTILDIGAGTGALYDHLQAQNIPSDYYGCDLSANMLKQSRIPPCRRQAGRLNELDFPVAQFDFIFALGVTSYMDDPALTEMLQYIRRRLHPEGTAVLSFTNAGSADYHIRQALRTLARRRFPQAGVIAQDFPVAAYTPEDIRQRCPGGLRIVDIEYFNPMIPPLERLAPKAYMRFASWATPRLKKSSVASRLFGDFLVFLKTMEPSNRE